MFVTQEGSRQTLHSGLQLPPATATSRPPSGRKCMTRPVMVGVTSLMEVNTQLSRCVPLCPCVLASLSPFPYLAWATLCMAQAPSSGKLSADLSPHHFFSRAALLSYSINSVGTCHSLVCPCDLASVSFQPGNPVRANALLPLNQRVALCGCEDARPPDSC